MTVGIRRIPRNDALALGVIACGIVAGCLIEPRAIAGAWHLYLFGHELPGSCWFLRLTGRPCAGCGLTRSVVLALHGRLGASIEQHPFGVAALAMAAAFVPPRAVAFAGTGRDWPITWDRWWNRAMLAVLLAMMGWWALRMM